MITVAIVTLPLIRTYPMLVALPRSATVTTTDLSESDSLFPIQCLQDEASATAIFALVRACLVPSVAKWAYEL